MNKQLKVLSENEIKFLKRFLEEHKFNSLTHIIYKGQIPMAAYVLIDGSIKLQDSQKRIIQELEKNSLIGFSEICTETPFKFNAEISPGSSVLILDRSTINQIKEIFQVEKPKENFITEALLTSIA